MRIAQIENPQNDVCVFSKDYTEETGRKEIAYRCIADAYLYDEDEHRFMPIETIVVLDTEIVVLCTDPKLTADPNRIFDDVDYQFALNDDVPIDILVDKETETYRRI